MTREITDSHAQGAAMDLSGKVAIVTGSGRGLGLAYAKALAAAGAAVVVNDIDAAVAQAAADEITAAGGKAVAVAAAVGTSEATQQPRRHGRRGFGRLDVLVANAGRAARQGGVEDDRRGLRPRHPGPPQGHLHLRARRDRADEGAG
jgi:NAD(P)-dependent dehydrogenase (short-subunit alcohol dehydrogenase family)